MARWRWCRGRVTKRNIDNIIKSILVCRPTRNHNWSLHQSEIIRGGDIPLSVLQRSTRKGFMYLHNIDHQRVQSIVVVSLQADVMNLRRDDGYNGSHSLVLPSITLQNSAPFKRRLVEPWGLWRTCESVQIGIKDIERGKRVRVPARSLGLMSAPSVRRG